MEWQQFIINIFEQMSKEMESSLDGLTIDDVNQQPSPDTNSIGWLTWHLARAQDRAITELSNEEQMWIKDKWYVKFNRLADPEDSGFGHGPNEIAAFQSPDVQILLGYYRAMLEQAKNYITTLSEADLDRKIDHPRFPTVGARLIGTINDSYQHVGQIAYVRGLLKGMGWWGKTRRR